MTKVTGNTLSTALEAAGEPPEGYKALPIDFGFVMPDWRSGFEREPGTQTYVWHYRPPLARHHDWRVYFIPEGLTL